MTHTNRGTVLVTGGTGFLARHTIARMLDEGRPVRATVRSPEKAQSLRTVLQAAGAKSETLDIVTADLLDPSSWPAALDGVRHVLHMATPMQGEAVHASAMEGTRNVLEASARAGVERVVVTSSGLAALRPGRPLGAGDRVTEDDWTDIDRPGIDTYAKAKTEAERQAWALSKSLGLQLTTILPGVILGPVLGPDRSIWQGVVGDMLAGRLKTLPPMRFQVIDVRDVADLHIAALGSPSAAGQRYIAAGNSVSLSELAQILQAKLGAEASRVSSREMPAWLFRLLAMVSAEARAGLQLVGPAPYLDATKARRELGWTLRSAEESVLDTARSVLAA